MPKDDELCDIIQSIARQNSIGAKIHPCLTPDEVAKDADAMQQSSATPSDTRECTSPGRSYGERYTFFHTGNEVMLSLLFQIAVYETHC